MNKEIADKIRQNSRIFLRNAVKELISHDDSNDDGLSQEVAVVACVFIQMSFELALLAYLVEREGIRAVVKVQDEKLTEEKLLSKFKNNKLSTKTFNELAKYASDKNLYLREEDSGTVEGFQRKRNKLVHLNYDFNQDELYELKYDLVYFLVYLVIPILSKEEARPSTAIASCLNKSDFAKLIKFPPYATEMRERAKNFSKDVYKCFECGNESLAASDYGNEHCFSCNQYFSHVGFTDCARCKSRNSIIYDKLNIKYQSDRSLKGKCLKCGDDDLIYSCESCGEIVALEATSYGKCTPEHCEEKES
ncbi:MULTISPECIES: hypothetical protein [Pseudomonas]|uniref:hypothetical protein n=1 Tax=Pseudomonas TaxID=286 RepID=UPI001C65F6BE|nr:MULTISPECIES: hypothetical protein [unclassified Pseudomonas]MBW8130573.1 hypothetical protein [Pseudomonas sp. LAP_36]MBW8139642.1 hypothetical protein [Pseudomonas sp. PAMC 26818]